MSNNLPKYLPKLELFDLEKLKPNDDNPRFIRDKDFAKLLKSMKDSTWLGSYLPIVVDEDGTILGGNMRYQAAKELGWSHIIGIQAKDLTEDQRAELIIKHNTQLGSWDFDMLANQYDAELLESWGLDVPLPIEDEEPSNDEGKDTPPTIEVVCKTQEEALFLFEKLDAEGYAVTLKGGANE